MAKLKFFNLDLHISVIKDVQTVFNHLFDPLIEVTNWSISGHNWVFGNPTPDVKIINQHTWPIINPHMIADFHRVYNSFLETFDGFIVTHTPVFSLIYEKYNKPIIIVNSCRYNQPFTNEITAMGNVWLNDSLQRMFSKGQLIVISNNKADQEYLLRGAGVPSIHIPSLCLYTCASYNPIRDQFICQGDRALFPDSTLLIEKPSRIDWSDLYSYRGIVHVPYEISTMSIFEQYSAGVPLWFPSKEFYKQCILSGKITLGSFYGNICWDALAETASSIDFWLDRADYYDSENMKYVKFYSSVEDLMHQLATFSETEEERRMRMDWIAARRASIYTSWLKLFDDNKVLASIYKQ